MIHIKVFKFKKPELKMKCKNFEVKHSNFKVLIRLYTRTV